jgi:hypothetical protein
MIKRDKPLFPHEKPFANFKHPIGYRLNREETCTHAERNERIQGREGEGEREKSLVNS